MEPSFQKVLIAGALARHEEAISELYKQIGVALPAMTEFWNRLASDEKAHAAVLASLVELEKKGSVVFCREAFRTKAILEAIEFAVEKRKQIELEGIGELTALSLAVSVERGMLESKFFNIYEEGCEAMRCEFDELRRHTVEHLAALTRTLASRKDVTR